jgi:sulfate permease, SulP family
MAFDLAAGKRLPASGSLDAALRNMAAGAVCAIVSLAFSLSYAALIFSGPLTPYLAYGIAATFITAAIGAIVMASRSSLPFALASPDASTSAVTAALVATLAGRLLETAASEHLLGSTLIVLSLSAALTGLVLCGLGVVRAGRAVRFVPYPVIGGFLGAAGWLIAAGAIQIMTGHRLTLSGIANFLDGLTLAKFAAGAGVAAVLLLGRRRFTAPLAQPAMLLACAAAVYAGLALFGISLPQAQADGWMFQPPSAAAFSPPWNLDEWRRFPWHLLPSLSGDFIAVMFVATVSILLNVAGLEVTAKREANLDRELAAAGVANFAAAAFGGYVTGVPLSRSTLAFKLAANSRIPSLCVAASSAAMLAVSPGFLSYVPKCVLGGLLLTLGIDLLYRWLVASSRQLSRMEYLSLVGITLMIINWDFVAGVLVGIVISCATFALSASRVSAVKFSFDGTELRSSLDRGPKELALLAQHGRELQGMTLQSYLFFGSANQLHQHVKQLLAARPDCRHLLFDFRLVTGIDSSATHSFEQIKQIVDKSGVQLVLINLSPAMTSAFRATGFLNKDIVVGSDLDHALESCEDAIIAAHRPDAGGARSLRDWLAEELDTPEHADALAQRCKRIAFRPGDIIARQGERSDSMHFILEGRVGVIVDVGGGRRVRVRSLGQHTTIGEMGLITQKPRSATIEAETASVLYELSVTAYERIKIEDPPLSRALLTYVIRVMAERLSFASRSIGVLQR